MKFLQGISRNFNYVRIIFIQSYVYEIIIQYKQISYTEVLEYELSSNYVSIQYRVQELSDRNHAKSYRVFPKIDLCANYIVIQSLYRKYAILYAKFPMQAQELLNYIRIMSLYRTLCIKYYFPELNFLQRTSRDRIMFELCPGIGQCIGNIRQNK